MPAKGGLSWNKGTHYKTGKDTRFTRVCSFCSKDFLIYPSANYRKFCSQRCYGNSMKGIPLQRIYPEGFGKWNLGKKIPKLTGEKNHKWKGQDVSYSGLHHWVKAKLGKPQKCSSCGTDKRRIQWANIDHKYRRDLNDFIALCVPCHRKHDYLLEKGSRP